MQFGASAASCTLALMLPSYPRSGELRTQKLMSHLVRTQSLNVLPLEPGVGQHIAIHATLTARNFFLAYFYPSSPFACIFSKTSPEFSSRSGELRTQKLKSHLVRSQSLNVLPFKPSVGQYIAIHATLTARNFFLAYFYPSSSFTRIFSKPLPIFFCVGCG